MQYQFFYPNLTRIYYYHIISLISYACSPLYLRSFHPKPDHAGSSLRAPPLRRSPAPGTPQVPAHSLPVSLTTSSGVLRSPRDRVLAKRSRPFSVSPVARAALTIRVLLAVALVVTLHLHVLQERLHLLLILEVNQARHGSDSHKPGLGPAYRSREVLSGRGLSQRV